MAQSVRPLGDYLDLLEQRGLLVSRPAGLDPTTPVALVSYDSRQVEPGTLFVCKGAHFKAEFLQMARDKGAMAYVSLEPYPQVDLPCIRVTDMRETIAPLADLYYGHPSGDLKVIGITGTKGKSSTAYYLKYILDEYLAGEGRPASGIISSIDTYDGTEQFESHLTTPEPLELQRHFAAARDNGLGYVTMEVSSQALKYHRTLCTDFAAACFLNIGTDHISPIEHPDFADYYASKLKLFDSCRVGCVNTDADHAADTVAHARSSGCELITFGSHASDTVFCERVEKRADGLYFTVRSPKYNGEFSITMPGLFNVSNALAAMAISMALGVPEEFVRSGLRKARANGRMQVYESRDKRVTVIVDYAHNRMSFDALYRSTRVEYPGKEMISVFGCPGSHALQRRRDLGELSGENCAFVYITEEDSGEEPFAQIAADIEKHVKCPHLVCEDRAECIRRAILDHPEPHVILLTGKGEETTMKRGREFVPFLSDVELTLKYLAEYDEKEAKA